jgi:hypothetical protein
MINTITKNYYHERFVSYTITYQNSDMIKSVPLNEANTDYQMPFRNGLKRVVLL